MPGHESSRNIYPKRAQTKLDVCAALYVSAHNKLLIVIVGCRFARRINEQRANNAICHVYIQQLLVMYCKARRTLSSRHTLHERNRVHNRTPAFWRGCLLPRIGRTRVQWSQILRFNGSEPRAVGSSGPVPAFC